MYVVALVSYQALVNKYYFLLLPIVTYWPANVPSTFTLATILRHLNNSAGQTLVGTDMKKGYVIAKTLVLAHTMDLT